MLIHISNDINFTKTLKNHFEIRWKTSPKNLGNVFWQKHLFFECYFPTKTTSYSNNGLDKFKQHQGIWSRLLSVTQDLTLPCSELPTLATSRKFQLTNQKVESFRLVKHFTLGTFLFYTIQRLETLLLLLSPYNVKVELFLAVA